MSSRTMPELVFWCHLDGSIFFKMGQDHSECASDLKTQPRLNLAKVNDGQGLHCYLYLGP